MLSFSYDDYIDEDDEEENDEYIDADDFKSIREKTKKLNVPFPTFDNIFIDIKHVDYTSLNFLRDDYRSINKIIGKANLLHGTDTQKITNIDKLANINLIIKTFDSYYKGKI